MKKMSAYSHCRRFLASVLVLAMVLAIIPGDLIPKASAASRIPANISPERTVIVAGEGAAYTAGTAKTATTLEEALEYLEANNAAAAGLIVIAGTVTQSGSLKTEYKHTGTYYITGSSSAYGVSGGKLYFSVAGNTNNDLGGPTVFENIELQIVESSGKYFRLHANTSLIFGDGVTVTDPSNRLRLLGGSYFRTGNSYIELNSGTVKYVYASNISHATGICEIVIDGTANVSSFISVGGWDSTNDKGVNDVIVTVKGGSLNAICNAPNATGLSTDCVTVNFYGGTSLKGLIDYSSSDGTGTITGNYIVNLRKEFVPGEKFGTAIPTLADNRVSTLYLENFDGVLDSKIDFTAFDNIIVESGAVEYSGSSLPNQNILAYAGSSLYIPNVAAEPAGATASGAVYFGTHNWGEWAPDASASCEQAGKEIRRCLACGESETRDVSAAAHSLIGHEAKAATCTENGNSAYWSCSVCGKYFSDAEGKTEIAENSWILPAKHSLQAVAYKAPTTEETGIKAHYKCSVCGDRYLDAAGTQITTETEVTIPKLTATGKLGDADSDGHTDAYDASLIKKYSVGAISASDLNLSVLDLDGDGHVDAYDASLIQKYSVGAIEKFPVEDINTVNHSEKATTVNAGETIKLLMIGGSFSRDAMNWLYNIAQNAGVNMELGIVYKGGSSLSQHIANGANTVDYYYYTVDPTTGQLATVKDSSGANQKFSMGEIVSRDWDYISLQQTSGNSGQAEKYDADLPALVELVRSINSSAKLIWHATWSYQQDSTHGSFPNYDGNQIRMYNMILDCLDNNVKPVYDFDIIIPNTTVIQNVRTSYIGDTLARDGYHLNENYGRYVVALNTFAAITGMSVDDITYIPDERFIDSTMLAVAKEAVKNAIANPMMVTKSSYAAKTDAEIAAIYGVDLSNYVEVNWAYTTNASWKCNTSTEKTVYSATSSAYNKYVCSTGQFTTNQLPDGTVFVMDHNWQSRLHIWTSKTEAYSGSRPSATGTPFHKLSDNLYDGNYIAWNLAYLDWRYTAERDSDLSALFDEVYQHFRVYVPING